MRTSTLASPTFLLGLFDIRTWFQFTQWLL
jgi:hypothetical protein